MARPTIFNVSAIWDDEASVWSGHCDEIPAAADSATRDLAPDNHPEIDPSSIYIQINALREAIQAAA